jgi:UDP-N-acetyl-2-amino-2-deoxyglucuronate dehydrogenase
MTEQSMAPEPLRFGIVGCGVIGQTHAAAVSSLADAELMGVADVVPERAHALADTYGIAAYPDLAGMVATGNIDVVTVCTASGLHGAHAREAMRAGKHVIVEKPLEITLPAIDDLLQVQRAAGVKLAVISQHRYDPAARQVHELIAAGAFGTLVLANAHILWWRSQEYYDSGDWRGTWALDGGGVLMNQSIHSIDLLQWFMGPVQSVCAYTGTLAHRIETEDTAVAALRFAGGALGSISATTGAYPGVSTRLEILGSEGSAVIEDDRLSYLHLKREGGDDVGPYGLETRERAQPGSQEPEGDAHALQIADIVREIRRDGTPMVDGKSARHDVAIILAIYESARTGREVVLQ